MQRRDVLKSVAFVAANAGLAITSSETAGAVSARTEGPTKNVPQMPFIETHDHTYLFYKDWGGGKPVIFMHGSPVNSDMWQYQMAHLASQGLRCIAYDRRGHGRSSQPGHGYDYDTLADDLAAIIERLDLRGVTLVGHSMSGGEIVRYLTRHGAGRIARTVFVAATTPFPLKTEDNPDGVDKSRFDQARAVMSKDSPRFFASGAPAFFGVGLPKVSVSSEMMQWGVNLCFQTSLKAIIECNRALTETDLRSEMRKITVPTLVIHGDADQSAPIDLTGRKTAQLIPGSQFKVYEGAPHGLFITHMDRLNSDLLAFIKV